jgi:hypothetical protein
MKVYAYLNENNILCCTLLKECAPKNAIELEVDSPDDVIFDNEIIRIKTLEEKLLKFKELKMNEIKQKFMNAMANGVIDFTIPSSGIQVQVDARRSNINNDLQNVEGLIEMMQLQNISEIQYKCYDNNKYTFTLQDMIALKYALMNYGLQLYAKKHMLEDMVKQATTKEELEQIVW